MAMTINCIDEMNLFFHMQNHYKKLKTAKSQINNFSQRSQNLPSSRSEKLLRVYNSNERHEKICPLLNQKRKKQNGIKSKSEPCMMEGSVRNKVHENQNSELPVQLQFMKKGGSRQNRILKQFKKSEEKEESIPKINIFINENYDNEKTNSTVNENENTDDSKSTNRTIEDINEMLSGQCLIEKELQSTRYSRAEEHEYLQFLLRITEDIIINNYSKTEDIENVFERHIDINKERLSMEKMLAQIEGLSSALNISSDKYKTSSNCTEKHVFEPFTESYNYNQCSDCGECSAKRFLSISNTKLLNDSLSVKELYVNSEDNLNVQQLRNNSDSNSCFQLNLEDLKYPSEAEIPKSNDVLHFPETIELNEENNEVLYSNNRLDEISTTGSTVTPAESVRFEEDPGKKNLNNKSCDEIVHEENNTEIDLIETENQSVGYSPGDHENILPTFQSKSNIKLQRELTFIKSDSISTETVQSIKFPTESSSSIKHKNLNLEEKCTQVLVEYKDEECNTSTDILNDVVDVDSGYVLINGPLYILKEALSPERRIVLSEQKHVDIDIAPVKESSPLLNNTFDKNLDLSDYSLLSQEDSSLQYNLNLSRLLHSDYDLTPQKDECANKYHYLMVDAYTSISNANIKDQISKQDLLVRSETYLNNNHINQETNQNEKNKAEEVKQNLLTKSEEYLLQSIEASFGSSMNGKIRSDIEYEESEESLQMDTSSEILSSQSNILDKYRIKGRNCEKSIPQSYELKRHKSLQ